MRFRFIVPVAALALLVSGGCSLAPSNPPPELDLPADYANSGPWRPARPADAEPRGAWWHVFGDARLSEYLMAVELANPSLEAAAQRVAEARAISRIAEAPLFPFLGASGASDRSRNSGTLANNFAGGRTRTSLRLALDVGYEVDLWGRLRNLARATAARAEAAEGDRRTLQLTLQADLALTYYALRAQDAEIALLVRTVALRRRGVDLATVRFAGGDAARLEVAQAETELASTLSERIGLDRRRLELLHALAQLQGLIPGQFPLEPIPLDLDAAPPAIPKNVPSDLLQRRPDIAAAARLVAATNLEIGVARAAWFPQVTLGATGGSQSSAVTLLSSSASQIWTLGAGFDWAIFEAGRIRGGVDAAKARSEAAGATYREVVLRAVGEVENALSALDILERQSAAQRTTVESANRTVELAQKRYDAGVVPYFEVLDAQRSLLRAEQELTRIQGERFAATVILIKALGGGWAPSD